MELTIELPENNQRLMITGPGERNLKMIRESLGINIIAKTDVLRLSGESSAVGQAAYLLEQLAQAAESGRSLSRQELLRAIATVASQPVVVTADPNEEGKKQSFGVVDTFDVYLPGKRVQSKTPGQQVYFEAMQTADLTFCCGPAGTGKTYLAVAAAVHQLKKGEKRKLVLCRPAVEAGEKLGFLPGSMQDKVNPYLRPLLDALHDMMEFEQIQRFMAVDLIEIVPLAFMRGRTLNDAMIILDEAQNTTRSQMLMFLTRLGHGSKMVVTGDTSQTDLDDPRDSGLVDAMRRLRHTQGVEMVSLMDTDIVRHSLVQRIVKAYEPIQRQPTLRTQDDEPAA